MLMFSQACQRQHKACVIFEHLVYFLCYVALLVDLNSFRSFAILFYMVFTDLKKTKKNIKDKTDLQMEVGPCDFGC